MEMGLHSFVSRFSSSALPVTEVPISAPQASLHVAINLSGVRRLPAKEDNLPGTHLSLLLADMSSEEDPVVSWCFSQTLGECPSGRPSAQGTILAAIPQSFIFTFLLKNRNPDN